MSNLTYIVYPGRYAPVLDMDDSGSSSGHSLAHILGTNGLFPPCSLRYHRRLIDEVCTSRLRVALQLRQYAVGLVMPPPALCISSANALSKSAAFAELTVETLVSGKVHPAQLIISHDRIEVQPSYSPRAFSRLFSRAFHPIRLAMETNISDCLLLKTGANVGDSNCTMSRAHTTLRRPIGKGKAYLCIVYLPPDLDGFDVNGPGNASGALSQIDEIAAGTALPDPSVSTANVNSSVSASLSSPACLLPPALIDHTVHLTAPSSVGYVSASKVTDICTSGLPSRGHQQLQSAILTFETTWARAKSIWEQVVLCTEACESKARAAYLEWASSGFRYTSSSF